MLFEGIKDTMEAGNWPKELRQTVVSQGLVQRSELSRTDRWGACSVGI